MKKISIIMSVYNCEEYLDDCLSSVEKQTMKESDYEFIIINDGSKDNGINIIKRYLKNHKNWHLIDRENKGLSVSRNEGLDICEGKYVTFLDSDDYLDTNALSNMYSEAEKIKADVSIFRTRNFNSKKVWEDALTSKLDSIPSEPSLKDSILLSSCIRSVAILYKKSLINNIRFIEDVIHEDNYFCIKAYSNAKKIYISKTIVYNIRSREGSNLSITQKLNIDTYKDMLFNIIKADSEIKSPTLVKAHANQLFGYILLNVKGKSIYEAYLLLQDYLLQMYEKKIINWINYIRIKCYIMIKYNIKFFKKRLRAELKKYYLCLLTIINPKLNVKIFFKARMGRKLNLKKPNGLNEKVQWLKLNYIYPNPLITRCSDKVEVRNYIKDIGCEELLINVIDIFNSVDDIDFSKLPNQFVLKWNFGYSYNIICTNKDRLNIRVTKKLLKKWGKTHFHLYNVEYNYKDIKRKILCEEYLKPKTGKIPEDYKFYCYNGRAKCVMICVGRDKGKPLFYYYDKDWNYLKYDKVSENLKPSGVIKPNNIDEMFRYAEKIAENFPFVRVDLYSVDNKIYFGELTFTPSAGLDEDLTELGEHELGNDIDIEGLSNEK